MDCITQALFKAKNKYTKEWVIGFFVNHDNYPQIWVVDDMNRASHPVVIDFETISRITVFQDEYKVDVFENDIVYFKANSATKKGGWMTGVMGFDGFEWIIKNENGEYSVKEEIDEFSTSRVRGNQFDIEGIDYNTRS